LVETVQLVEQAQVVLQDGPALRDLGLHLIMIPSCRIQPLILDGWRP
jgi:hypothetical protein